VASWTRRLYKNGSVPTSSASALLRTSAVWAWEVAVVGINQQPNTRRGRNQFPQQPKLLRPQLGEEEGDTGRISARPARLATRPSATGSSVTLNTSGIVVVAVLAANAGAVPPVAIMRAT
jgi:hypothetical protein